MKRMIAILCACVVSISAFAQTFESKKFAFQGVAAASVNNKDAVYELTAYEPDKDLLYFTYTWTQETKLLLSKSYTQYKCFLNVTSTEEDGVKKLVTKIENPIYFRVVNADGSEIQGTPKIKGVSYTWAENKTILNKKETLNAVVQQVEKDILAELNKPDEEMVKSLITFFSNDVNLTYFDTDTLGKLANNYKELCSVPALVWKLQTEKSEIWYTKYADGVKDTTFANTFEIQTIKESNIPEYKYLVECMVSFSVFQGDSFNQLMEGMKGVLDQYGESYIGKELREKTFKTYGGSPFRHVVFIDLYSNDDKYIDMNKGTVIEVNGKLQSINIPGSLLKEITSFTVFEK